MNRRDFVTKGLVVGAALAIPGRALAQAADQTLERAFDAASWTLEPTPPVPTVPVAPPVDPVAYKRRVFEVAAREVERQAHHLWRRDIVGLADFGRPSSEPRFHFVNLEDGTMRSFLVAHGRGSDREHDGWLKQFSNTYGSEMTSRGGYLTCEWYNGKYGTSVRLEGLDPDNSRALERAIVMHPAWYVDPQMIGKWGKIGRSEGCFAMAPGDFNEALVRLSGGRLLFADRIVV